MRLRLAESRESGRRSEGDPGRLLLARRAGHGCPAGSRGQPVGSYSPRGRTPPRVAGEVGPAEGAGLGINDSESTAPVVVTGFEPFGGRAKNRSWELVRRLGGRPGVEVTRLPVDFRRLGPAVDRIVRTRPEAILMVGEAPGQVLRVEQIGLNVAHSERPDNAGRRPRSEEVVSGGALALRATWDAAAVARRLHREGIEASVSFHAGTYACNAALYGALHLACGTVPGGGPAIGFLHVPEAGEAGGPADRQLIRALGTGIEELLAARREARADAYRRGDAPE